MKCYINKLALQKKYLNEKQVKNIKEQKGTSIIMILTWNVKRQKTTTHM